MNIEQRMLVKKDVDRCIAKYVEQYKYSTLPAQMSKDARKFYIKMFTKVASAYGMFALETFEGTRICEHYTRVVVGDYGAYFEICPSLMTDMIVIKEGQEYRLDPKYDKVKYEWYTIEDGSDIKIYKQLRTVKYADYVPGMYYVSVFDVIQVKIKDENKE